MTAVLPFVLAGLALLAKAGEPIRAAPLPFEFVLAPEDEPRFLDPREAGQPNGAVSLTVNLPGKPRPWRLDLFEDRTPASPSWRWLTAARSGESSITLAQRPGMRVLAVASFEAPGSYLLSGPLRWPESPRDIALEEKAQRTIRGELSGAADGVVRILGGGGAADSLCERLGARRWQCISVPVDFDGVAAVCGPGYEMLYGGIERGASLEVPMRKANWSALVEARAPGGSQPEPQAAVTILRPGPAGGRYLEAEPEVDVRNLSGGSLWIAGFRPVNEQVLQFKGPGSVSNRLGLRELVSRAPCGEVAPVELAAAALIRGVVSDSERRPLSEAQVLLLAQTGASPARILASTETDAGGLYEFRDLAAGGYRVRACHPAWGCAERAGAAGEEPVDVVISPHGVLRGRVVSSAGVPEANAAVRILTTLDQYAGASDRSTFLPLQLLTGADGRFQIAPPRNGRFAVEARSNASGTARRSVEITDFSPPVTDLGDLTLSDVIEFAGLVANCAGGSLALAGPILGDSPMPGFLRFEVGPDGRAVIRLPDGGTWLVRADCSGVARSLEPGVLYRVEELGGLTVTFKIVEEALPK